MVTIPPRFGDIIAKNEPYCGSELMVTVNLAARLDDEAANADSLTAHILAFANGTAVKLMNRRHWHLKQIAHALRETDLPHNLQLYDQVNNMAWSVLLLSDKMSAINIFGSAALDFFAREYATLEANLKKAFSTPTVEQYAILGSRVGEFVERFTEKIREYTGIINDALDSAKQIMISADVVANFIDDNAKQHRNKIDSNGQFYKVIQSLTIEGRRNIKDGDVLSTSSRGIIEIQQNLVSARRILMDMSKSADSLQREIQKGSVAETQRNPEEIFHRFKDTVLNMQSRRRLYNDILMANLVE
ncbi:hypothetical protein C8R43DRAFT_954243 [Mycena crocata]|nr:hypothetical protein C8R43DRAFT_954243 [Mycena crocata]